MSNKPSTNRADALAASSEEMTLRQVRRQMVEAVEERDRLRYALGITQRSFRGNWSGGFAIYVTGHEMETVQGLLGIEPAPHDGAEQTTGLVSELMACVELERFKAALPLLVKIADRETRHRIAEAVLALREGTKAHRIAMNAPCPDPAEVLAKWRKEITVDVVD